MYNRQLQPMNGAFKGRGRQYLSLLCCPEDRAALALGDKSVGCTANPAHVYPFENGILRLIPARLRAEFETQSERHEQASAGRHAPDEDEFKSLPQAGIAGYPDGYWANRAAATALLWRYLEAIRLQNGILPVGPVGEAAVIGAETGWLAYGLDVAGYATAAIDVRTGEKYGLGVYPIARYMRVQADLLDPPLAAGAYDLVVYQEGLPAVDDDAQWDILVKNAQRGLRSGGWLAIMAFDLVTADPIEARLRAAGMTLMEKPQRQGMRVKLGDIRDRVLGRNQTAPPVIVAQKRR